MVGPRKSDCSRFSNASRFRERKGSDTFFKIPLEAHRKNKPIQRRGRPTDRDRRRNRRGFGGAARRDSLSLAVNQNGFDYIYVYFTKLWPRNCDLDFPSPVVTQSNHELSFIVPVDVSCRHSRRRLACELARFLSGYSQAALSVC